MSGKEMEECRKAFSEWWRENGPEILSHREDDASVALSIAVDAWQAAWNRRAVPEGFRLVPVEPTSEMLFAADEEEDRCAIQNYGGACNPEDIWAVMLNAAPEYGEGKG